jgi:hypothetical protein
MDYIVVMIISNAEELQSNKTQIVTSTFKDFHFSYDETWMNCEK